MPILEILIGIFYSFLFYFIIRKLKFWDDSFISRNQFILLFSLKVFAGVAVWQFYNYQYERAHGDVFRFYDDARIAYDNLKSYPISFLKFTFGIGSDQNIDTLYPKLDSWDRDYNYRLAIIDNRTIIRFNLFLFPFTQGVYFVHVLFHAFLSFIGLVSIYKAFKTNFSGKEQWLIASIFIIPSLLFWSSAVLKESLLMFGLGIFLREIKKIIDNQYSSVNYWALLIGFFTLFSIKAYVLIILTPGILTILFLKIKSFSKPVLAAFLLNVAMLILVINLKHINPKLDIIYVIFQKSRDAMNEAFLHGAGSLIEGYEKLQPNLITFIKRSPEALLNALFRPFPSDLNRLLYWPNFLETLIWLFAIIFTIFRFKKPEKSEVPILIFLVLFCFYFLLLVGLTTPLIGSIVRYRIPVLPFLLILLGLLNNQKNQKFKLNKNSNQ